MSWNLIDTLLNVLCNPSKLLLDHAREFFFCDYIICKKQTIIREPSVIQTKHENNGKCFVIWLI